MGIQPEAEEVSKSPERVIEEIDDLFEKPSVAAEEFSLKELSSTIPESASATWLLGYKEEGLKKDSEDPRIRQSITDGRLFYFIPFISLYNNIKQYMSEAFIVYI